MIDPSVGDWRRIMAAQAHGHEDTGPGWFHDFGYTPEGAPEYGHGDGRRCVQTDKGYWMRWGEGIDSDALCPLPHPSPVPTVADAMFANEAAKQRHEDVVGMPSHYTHLPVEAIDITEHFNFCMGNALKYIWRADHKGNPIQDLKKAVFYLQREIANREGGKYEQG